MVKVPIRNSFQRNTVVPVRLWQQLNCLGVSVYFDWQRNGSRLGSHDYLLSFVQDEATQCDSGSATSGRGEGRT